MTWTDLGDPLPRQEPRRYQTIQWDIGEVYRLPVCVLAALTQPFSDVLDARMTVRQFGVLDWMILNWLNFFGMPAVREA